ncbi:geranylgeranyl pyrophosphate synthase [Listeria cornellensis FSL F6-0969]|uniref:Geranylgeranyl pyrophosphate synthase n=1 Tax=Listeria cornellensis FSL F6-0969 TaxID=1265820 RepID=W7CDE7_9LIST|nr:geranylgeranyl pyrophosphate synthase [Listeria cornellensis FSL F6-0969]
MKKSTYPALLSLDGAKQALVEHTESAKQALQKLDIDATFFIRFNRFNCCA